MTGQATMKLPVGRPVRAVRVHRMGNAEAGGQTAHQVQWLLDLQAKAEAERDAQHATMQCIGAIVGAVKPLPDLVAQRLDEIGAMVTEMALAVAREVVGEALDRGLVDPTETVQRCLRECVVGSEAGPLRIQLSPADLGPVMEQIDRDPEHRQRLGAVEFVADEGLQRGEVVARTGAGTLHYDPSEVFERLCDAVREEVAR